MKVESIDIGEAAVAAAGPEERVRQAIQNAQERRDTPLNGGFGLEMEDFEPPTIIHGVSYAGEDPTIVAWPHRQSKAMAAFVNRPA